MRSLLYAATTCLVVFFNALPLVLLPTQLVTLRVQSTLFVSSLALQISKLGRLLLEADAHVLLLPPSLSQVGIAAVQLIL